MFVYPDKYYPFYLNYGDPRFWEDERMQERENQMMQSFYPETAKKIQQRVTEVCDRMDYPGSMIYDEYPDKFMMEQLCRQIQGSVDIEAEESHRGLLDDLIRVLTFQEIRRRRCRRHNCRRYF